MVMIIFTMYFSSGMIPGYMNIQQLGLYNTRWAILLPGAISTFNMVIMRTAMQSIKYANIIVATLPILLLYPFLQKYFVKGMMVGAVKG